jgi:hypothetical protein
MGCSLERNFRAGAHRRLRETADRECLRGIASRWRLRDLGLFFIRLPTLLTLLHFIGTADSSERELKGQQGGSWVMGSLRPGIHG